MLCVVVPSDIQPFEESDIGDHPEDYVVSIAVSIPGLISNIKYTTSRGCTHSALVAGISTEPTISFESSKNWVFIVSHNYNDEKKKPSDPDFFMSLSFSLRCFIHRSMTYHSAMLNPPARYVLLQVVFDNDDERSIEGRLAFLHDQRSPGTYRQSLHGDQVPPLRSS